MRSTVNSIGEIKEIKNISGRRSIRDNFNNYEDVVSRKNTMNNNEDRSISEPPQLRYPSAFVNNHHNQQQHQHLATTTSSRLKPIREKLNDNEAASSEDEEEEEDFSKSNSQLNESDLDLEIPESASQTPTPTLGGGLSANGRRINSETNLNDTKRRVTGFMGNRSKRFCASTSELSFASHLDTNKSLFSPKNNRSRSGSSLYGSNMSLNSTNSRLFMANSPFYNGKTTFGGASAYPRRDINQHKVLRVPVQMRPSSSLSNSSVTSTKSEGGLVPESNAAKRILEIMTQFNGPLKETRNMGNNISSMMKIPGLAHNKKRFGDEELNLDRSISLVKPSAPYSTTKPKTSTASSNNNIINNFSSVMHSESPLMMNNSPQIPTMSQLLKMKRLHNNTERVREIANRSESFLNQVHEYKLPSANATNDYAQTNSTNTPSSLINSNATNSSSSLKMKNNITKNLLRNDKGLDQLPPEPVNLPNIQLPELKSIPSFNIQIPSYSAKPTTLVTPKSIVSSNFNQTPTSNAPAMTILSSTTTVKTSNTNSSSSNSIDDRSNIIINCSQPKHNFMFSNPSKIDTNNVDLSRLKSIANLYSFSKPLLVDAASKDATGNFVLFY
jgi:nuclear pore complex protein Nup153